MSIPKWGVSFKFVIIEDVLKLLIRLKNVTRNKNIYNKEGNAGVDGGKQIMFESKTCNRVGSKSVHLGNESKSVRFKQNAYYLYEVYGFWSPTVCSLKTCTNLI